MDKKWDNISESVGSEGPKQQGRDCQGWGVTASTNETRTEAGGLQCPQMRPGQRLLLRPHDQDDKYFYQNLSKTKQLS